MPASTNPNIIKLSVRNIGICCAPITYDSFEMITDGIDMYDNIVLVGGFADQCLKEVELALLILNKNFNFYHCCPI